MQTSSRSPCRNPPETIAAFAAVATDAGVHANATAATATGADQFPEAVTGWLPWAIVGLLAVVVIARR